MLMIELNSGRKVRIAAFHCQRIVRFLSSAGVLMGRPRALNRFILDNAATAMTETWGAHKSLLIMPRLSVFLDHDPNAPEYQDYLEHELLPPYLVHAWLTSDDHVTGQGDPSELVIAFFRNDIAPSIEQMVSEAAHSLSLDAIAEVVVSD